jgi:uncharacterized protein YciI
MSYFAVIREAGPAWTDGKGISDQPAVGDHAAFMNVLADQGFVLFGGPLAGSEHGRLRALLIVDAGSEAEIHRRLADDPWVHTGQVLTTSVEPWTIFVGAERAASALQARSRPREITSRWMSEVPSSISSSLASRIHFSTGCSRE